MTDAAKPHNPYHDSPAKETVISMVISLAMALVAKIYVLEAYVIPTGSMAPTLLGQHMLFRSPQSGYEWTVNPFYYADDKGQLPFQIQGNSGTMPNPTSTDPMSTSKVNGWTQNAMLHKVTAGYAPDAQPKPARAGDRILVHKYLYDWLPPKRYDVVVFKNPEDPSLNYIKRLIGLPNEQVWLADGDVFTRPLRPGTDGAPGTPADSTWQIQRKPDRIQSSLWRTMFSSEYTPKNSELSGVNVFRMPWIGDGWNTSTQTFSSGASGGALRWDTPNWPLWDWVPYNDVRANNQSLEKWPVSDLRVRAGIQPEQAGLGVAATIRARRHEFQGGVENGRAFVRMRPTAEAVALGAAGDPSVWTELASVEVSASLFTPGMVTNFEFWHADQQLEVWIDGERVVSKPYEWTAEQRIAFVTGPENPSIAEGGARLGNPLNYENWRLHPPGAPGNVLPAVEWEFTGSKVTLFRVGLDRDVYYEPRFLLNRGRPGLGTHPENLADLGPDQFFCCGDNSPNSFDGRMWGTPNPWVVAEIDGTAGIVHRKMLLGKAFFVYFPAPHQLLDRIPIPDFGRMRFIR